ncbi:hypothetical protein [Aquicoccus sp. SU-CL01552]|uniref:hypothetical protein n=1 Tax=Aquicoccus sp. SU-CL01552 TaxID=3127656 RepID=UPI00333E3908
MSRLRMIGLAGGTVACALGIGHVMQSTQPVPVPAPAPVAAQDTPAAPTPEGGPQLSPRPGALRTAEISPLDIEKIALTAAPAVPDPAPAAALPATPKDPEVPSLGCAVTALATPGPMATVDLAVSAPCLGNSRLVVHHNGMTFTAITDEDGALDVTVPALAERAVFIAAFDNGEGAVATTHVPDIADFDRIVLQWQGKAGFQIHALEFGASYGEPGHVWSGADPKAAGDRTTGTVVRLGTDDALSPLLAEVYTFPAAAADRSGDIALSVEAEVNADNCGRDISAQLLERKGTDRMQTRALDLTVPGCTAVGDFLVLNNLLDDLKIAAK